MLDDCNSLMDCEFCNSEILFLNLVSCMHSKMASHCIFSHLSEKKTSRLKRCATWLLSMSLPHETTERERGCAMLVRIGLKDGETSALSGHTRHTTAICSVTYMNIARQLRSK